MSTLATAVVVWIVLLGASLAGVALRRALPERYLDSNAKDVVRLGCALVATVSGLALGLLINSAKSSFDTEPTSLYQVTANLVLLDRLLGQYGPETQPVRSLLRQNTNALIDRLWGKQQGSTVRPAAAIGALLVAISELAPSTDLQRAIQARAIQTLDSITQSRLLLREQLGTQVPVTLLVVMTFWLATLFASFSLFSPLNPLALGGLVVIALSVSAAVFLILDMSEPFSGLLQLDAEPLRRALPPLKAG
jgi:hypothetical protein